MTGDDIVYHAFVMPHWLYWAIIFVFPTVFLILAHFRAKADAELKERLKVSPSILSADSKTGALTSATTRRTASALRPS